MVRFKADIDFGDTLYMKDDPDQQPCTLVQVILQPGSHKYVLSFCGELTELYDFEVTKEKNLLKTFGHDSDEEE